MSKEKLTIENLAPYLPYGVKCSNSKKSYLQIGKDRIGVLQQISVDDDSLILNEGGYFLVHYSEIIPILRPLSDLTKEIEHNGEKFVAGLKLVDPENIEWDKMVCEEYNPFPKIPDHRKWIQVKHEELGQVISINPNNIEHLRYDLFYKLFEWHFDVFVLIEKGLAINLNEVK